MLRYDGPLVTFLMKLGDMILLHIIWLICCIPVVTAGPATAAAHYVALKLVRNEGSTVPRMFFKAFRANFRQGVILGLVSLFAGALIVLDLYIFSVRVPLAGMTGTLLLAALVFLALLYGITMMWLWAVLVTFENTTVRTVINAFMMALGNWGATSMMLLQDVVLGILAVVSVAFFPQLAILFLIFGIPLFFVVNAFHLRKALDQLRYDLGERKEDE